VSETPPPSQSVRRCGDDDQLVAAVRHGDDRAFTTLAERYRRELYALCRRMVGSSTEAEDLVQVSLLRAWRRMETFEGRSTFRTWLRRIATNACLDALARRPRQPVPWDTSRPAPPNGTPRAVSTRGIESQRGQLQAADPDAAPDGVVLAKESIELILLATIRHLPSRQRAVLILRDVLGWRAKDVGAMLDISEAAVTSALQRARATLRSRLRRGRDDWFQRWRPTELERSLLERYVAAHEFDPNALATMVREEARAS
jgi:RNA polymerase sigma-70 factor, ECF subfamily